LIRSKYRSGELMRSEALDELECRCANIATTPFTGEQRASVSFAPFRLERLENGQLIGVWRGCCGRLA
jgi:hypothetical protein